MTTLIIPPATDWSSVAHADGFQIVSARPSRLTGLVLVHFQTGCEATPATTGWCYVTDTELVDAVDDPTPVHLMECDQWICDFCWHELADSYRPFDIPVHQARYLTTTSDDPRYIAAGGCIHHS